MAEAIIDKYFNFESLARWSGYFHYSFPCNSGIAAELVFLLVFVVGLFLHIPCKSCTSLLMLNT
jgi:hypothetical protein